MRKCYPYCSIYKQKVSKLRFVTSKTRYLFVKHLSLDSTVDCSFCSFWLIFMENNFKKNVNEKIDALCDLLEAFKKVFEKFFSIFGFFERFSVEQDGLFAVLRRGKSGFRVLYISLLIFLSTVKIIFLKL